MMLECPNVAANDVAWEGLVTLITFIGLRECATVLVMHIVSHDLE